VFECGLLLSCGGCYGALVVLLVEAAGTIAVARAKREGATMGGKRERRRV